MYQICKEIGSFFAHIKCLAEMKIGNEVHYLKSPVIKMRLGNQTWTNKSFLIWHKFYPQLIWGLDNFSEEAKGSVIMRNPMQSLKVLAASRAYKRFNFEVWREIIIRSKINFFSKFISFFISITPSIVLAIIYMSYIKKYRKNHTLKFSPKLALAKLKLLNKIN